MSNRQKDPGDWVCPACSNLNWAKRVQCNQCGIKKPEMVSQERYGRGGGFDERQSSDDYAKVQEDDDGFDDFGRKKTAKLDKAARRKAALDRLNRATSSIGGQRERSRSRSREG